MNKKTTETAAKNSCGIGEKEFADAVRKIGGRSYIVGGFVRDTFLGKRPKDKDYCVGGIDEKNFCALFPNAKKIGRAFPVYMMKIDGRDAEIAFLRREKKIGRGYRGFEAICDPTISIEDDLFRRDTTMNAMAIDILSGALIDPYGGQKDAAAGIIRAVSHHFADDPVRAIRAARQSAEHGFRIADETFAAMRSCGSELPFVAAERIFHETEAALKTKKPSLFFRNLQQADLLKIVFPEIFALIGKTQPVDFHPEGDAFEHSLLTLDKTAAMTTAVHARFAALVHDIGKGATPPEMLPHHYEHDERGLIVLAAWNERMTLPKIFLQSARLAITEHMRAPMMKKAGKKVELLLKINASPLGFDGFNALILADHGSLPPFLRDYAKILPQLLAVSGKDCPDGICGAKIGEWIRNRRAQLMKALDAD